MFVVAVWRKTNCTPCQNRLQESVQLPNEIWGSRKISDATVDRNRILPFRSICPLLIHVRWYVRKPGRCGPKKETYSKERISAC
jgi:hypothetical protein